MSRCNEIFYAFLRDAFDKLHSINNSELTYSNRIVLSLKSYLELIINFAIIYLLLPNTFWVTNKFPIDTLHSLYFSGVTITTLGYGDITPKHWAPQLLTVYEVFCGMILLVVCFAIYASRSTEISYSNAKKVVRKRSQDSVKVPTGYYVFFIAMTIIIIRIIFPKINFDNVSLYLFLIAVVVLIITDIGDIFTRIKRFKKGDFEVEFSERISELNKEIEKFEDEFEEDNFKFDQEFKNRVNKIFKHIENPRGALIILAVEIEDVVFDLAEYYGIKMNRISSPVRVILKLDEMNLLPSIIKVLFREFWSIRNQVDHERNFEITKNQEYEILDLGLRLLKLLCVRKAK